MNHLRRMRQQQNGFTLVELLVAVSIFAILMTMIGTALASAARSVDNSKQLNEVNEEARLAIVRMSRELRQSRSIESVTQLSDGSGFASAITFDVDFDGDGYIEATAADPEVLTYRYRTDLSGAGNGQIELTANDAAGTATVRPVVSGHVSDFHIELRSSLWGCDGNGDGITTWQEIDTSTSSNCPHPGHNGLFELEGEVALSGRWPGGGTGCTRTVPVGVGC